MNLETGIVSEEMTLILMMRDMILIETEIETGTTTDEGMRMIDPTALEAQGVTANVTDGLKHLGLTPMIRLNFPLDLMTRDAERMTTQQLNIWRRCCSLCSGSAFSSVHFSNTPPFNDLSHESKNDLTIPTIFPAQDRTYIAQHF